MYEHSCRESRRQIFGSTPTGAAMRIIAFTDIHGALDRVEGILGDEENFDVIVVGGDLTTFGTEPQGEEAVLRLLAFDRPLLVVAGNMDPVPLEQTFVRLGVSVN